MEEEYNNPQVQIRRQQIKERLKLYKKVYLAVDWLLILPKKQVTNCVIEQRTKYIEEVCRFHENPNKIATRFYARYNRNMRLIVYSEEEANLNDFERCKNVSQFYFTDKQEMSWSWFFLQKSVVWQFTFDQKKSSNVCCLVQKAMV